MAHTIYPLVRTAGLERQLGNSSKMIPLYVATLGLSSIHEPVLNLRRTGSGHEIIAAAFMKTPTDPRAFVDFRVSSFSSSVAEQNCLDIPNRTTTAARAKTKGESHNLQCTFVV